MRRRRNPRYDEWLPAHAVRFNADGSVSLLTEPRQNNPRRPISEEQREHERLLDRWAEVRSRISAMEREGEIVPDHLWNELDDLERRGYGNPQAIGNVTDRALRYRANADPPDGPKVCAFCGSRRNVEVGHLDGHEEHTDPENLIWTCRRCNTQMGINFARRGVGRRTRQYNPEGAQTARQWAAAVMSMKGESDDMSVGDAVALIRATPKSRRSKFTSELWDIRRRRGTTRTGREAVPF